MGQKSGPVKEPAEQAAYEAAELDVQRRDDKAEEIVQAQVRAAYM